MNYNFTGNTPTSGDVGKVSIGIPKSGDFGIHINDFAKILQIHYV
jgi:hypothetical protein